MKIYLRGANGESIEEPDDLDKEIALLKASVNKKVLNYETRNADTKLKAWKQVISKVIEKVNQRSISLQDLFYLYEVTTSFPDIYYMEEAGEYHHDFTFDKNGILKNWVDYFISDTFRFTERWIVYEHSIINYLEKGNFIDIFRINFQFKEHKTQNFSVEAHLQIHFEETKYSLISYQNPTKIEAKLTKRYGEPFTNEEAYQFATSHVKAIVDAIKEKSTGI
ncbi:MAG: hypothetical protein HC892_12775 [Saprospiraceae bacterium]|nr:hypothetical protein [Saprospiraceae bacterium]